MKLSKVQKQEVEDLALRIYDKRNPKPDGKINVRKDECILEAKKRLGFKT